jgi:hypothetical protein
MTWQLHLIKTIPLWIINTLFFRTLFIIVGWLVVPIGAGFKAYKPTIGYNGDGSKKTIYLWTWRWLALWESYDDGIANDTYVKFKSMFMKIVYWSCFRNPANGMRTMPFFSVNLDPARIRFVGSFGSWGTIDEATVRKYDTKIPHWFFCWQGWYSNLYIQWEMLGQLWRFWIGSAKIYPADIYGGNYPADYPNGRFGYRSRGAGPVIQFKRVKR